MKNKQWPIIYELFQEVKELQDKSLSVVAKTRKLVRGIQAEDIIKVRAGIRTKLDILKTRLSEDLNERETYLILFPIVIYFDEMVQTSIVQAKAIDWPLLQKELFDITNGGEMFYEVLDDILRKSATLPFIYEVFYFCLSDGFQGKYRDNSIKIKEYQDHLRKKIPLPKLEGRETAVKAPRFVGLSRFPVSYYALAAIFLAMVYLGLTLLADYSA